MNKRIFIQYISESNFQELFIREMGWNNPKGQTRFDLVIEDVTYNFEQIAERSGFQVLTCQVGEIPSSAMVKKIDTRLRRQANDYICIFYIQGTEHHLWVAPVKKVEKRDVVLVEYDSAEKAGFLLEKADNLSFALDEVTTIMDVKERVQGAFIVNSEKITNDFYKGFRKEHSNFAKFISGIDDHIIDLKDNRNKQWYTSVMLNRLMFCYFIQKKGFLDNNRNYLREKLEQVQREQGDDKFYTFYRGFLLSLFHDGLNTPRHEQDFVSKYGRIPYLNGGMFDTHELETRFPEIDIRDEAFESLFAFFDQWHWHLDDRLTANGKDINPDVLGYIFEQYINDRAQMGAYYTKEDITEFISRNTIVPFLLDATRQADEKPFRPDGAVWQFLRESGDTYIFDAVKKGHDVPLPDYISEGIDTTQPNLLERRSRWNERTPDEWALPTEIWRETVERRQRYQSVLQKIEQGEIAEVNDLITYNLDIRQFILDFLSRTDNHKFVLHFYHALQRVTILDPTCGSGAFLFAALNILEPLYETCIARMQDWQAQNHNLFKDELQELTAKYGNNQRYFIYKSIILRNLYGVDIMVEATEIAKLRLFLKMVAVVDVNPRDPNLGLEPLPDIDFNIRCGNTLVGYATERELQEGVQYADLFARQEFEQRVKDEMQKVSKAYDMFKQVQLSGQVSLDSYKTAKRELTLRLKSLNMLLNKNMHKATAPGMGFDDWKASHLPFHWLAEYYDIIQGNGGFDVIIGNPPYVVYNDRTFDYKVVDYKTKDCGDLYAFVIERSLRISANKRAVGMIVPISIVSTDGFLPLRNLMNHSELELWYSNYSMRPGKLFEGVEKHLSIFIGVSNESIIHSTRYHRWYTEERKNLFTLMSYTVLPPNVLEIGSIPKAGNSLGVDILTKLSKNRCMSFSANSNGGFPLYHTRKLRYFVQFLDKAPIIYNEDGSLRVTSELKSINYDSDEKRYGAIAVYLSTLFFWYFIAHSDCRNLNKREVDAFPFNLSDYEHITYLSHLGKEIIKNLQDNSTFLEATYKKYGKLSMQTFSPRLSKGIADNIDKLLANHYGFTDEELDFIINYDVKYRMGEELNEE